MEKFKVLNRNNSNNEAVLDSYLITLEEAISYAEEKDVKNYTTEIWEKRGGKWDMIFAKNGGKVEIFEWGK